MAFHNRPVDPEIDSGRECCDFCIFRIMLSQNLLLLSDCRFQSVNKQEHIFNTNKIISICLFKNFFHISILIEKDNCWQSRLYLKAVIKSNNSTIEKYQMLSPYFLFAILSFFLIRVFKAHWSRKFKWTFPVFFRRSSVSPPVSKPFKFPYIRISTGQSLIKHPLKNHLTIKSQTCVGNIILKIEVCLNH